MASSRLTNKSPKTHVYGVINNWRIFSSYRVQTLNKDRFWIKVFRQVLIIEIFCRSH
jgi:hypothetical protein